jgi:hypothetical protein
MRTRFAIFYIALLLVLFCASTAVSAQDRPIAMFVFEHTSCSTWVKSANSPYERAQYYQWFRGFVSGYNFGNPKNQVLLGRMPDEQTLYLFVDKYCRDNPLNPFTSAALQLVEELRERPGP